MEIHFISNSTMDELALDYLIPSLPSDLVPFHHVSNVQSSGNYGKDGYFDLIVDKVETILSIIESSMDDEVFIWSDVDVVFNRRGEVAEDISMRLANLSSGKDILLQMEFPEGGHVNSGFQVIRRNTRSLIFYAQVRLMLCIHDRSDEICINNLLRMIDGIQWGCLPLSYSCKTNGGLDVSSVIYHANGTPKDSLMSKKYQLSRAVHFWEQQLNR